MNYSLIKFLSPFLVVLSVVGNGLAQNVNWISFEEAIERNEKKPRKFLIDVYTDWCGWCKKMDASTYKNPVIVDYINEHYYAIKFNAEGKDTIRMGEQVFVNENPGSRRSTHQLTLALLDRKLTYPSTVFLDERGEKFHPPIAGYLDAATIEPILHYFSTDQFKTVAWEEFQKGFESGLGEN
jgi:thioredoxin-related protein